MIRIKMATWQLRVNFGKTKDNSSIGVDGSAGKNGS